VFRRVTLSCWVSHRWNVSCLPHLDSNNPDVLPYELHSLSWILIMPVLLSRVICCKVYLYNVMLENQDRRCVYRKIFLRQFSLTYARLQVIGKLALNYTRFGPHCRRIGLTPLQLTVFNFFFVFNHGIFTIGNIKNKYVNKWTLVRRRPVIQCGLPSRHVPNFWARTVTLPDLLYFFLNIYSPRESSTFGAKTIKK